MADCKDCIHENVCINNKAYDDYHFDSCEEKVNKLGCSNFKDKSKYIELPTKVTGKLKEEKKLTKWKINIINIGITIHTLIIKLKI